MFKRFVKRSLYTGLALMVSIPGASYALEGYENNWIVKTLHNPLFIAPVFKIKKANLVLHTDTLSKLYAERQYTVLWVDAVGRPNALSESLKNMLLRAGRHGLNPTDYWDDYLENIKVATAKNPKAWITFELLASEALIRYVTHLSVGRFDPADIDSDIRFKQRKFVDFSGLNSRANLGPEHLESAIDVYAPNNSYYKDLMVALTKLDEISASGTWKNISYPKAALRLGSQSDIIPAMRARFRAMGYQVSDSGGRSFDAEFDEVLRLFQTNNGLVADGIIGSNSEVIRELNYDVNKRKAQVSVTMEKLRWLPNSLEDRHIFVNLSSNRLHMQDQGRRVFDFKVITGQVFRRTPTMRNLMYKINFNPTWGVPETVAMNDKFPEIKRDRDYLTKHDMVLYTRSPRKEVKYPYSGINFNGMTASQFDRNYFIIQRPSYMNALGRAKFLLNNNEDIYLHDTNEREIFKVDPNKPEARNFRRNISSGCIRLEYPLELAAYLLDGTMKSNGVPWSLETIQSFVTSEEYPNLQSGQTTLDVELKKNVPVYMMNLSVFLDSKGRVAFVPDFYGQDGRVEDAIRNTRVGGEVY